jgi:cyanophycinase-like exopeptidase
MMPDRKGSIVLMGSGELTATMVEVHKEQLDRFGGSAKAVFLDTPAGFQLNVDQITHRALDYFNSRVGYPMAVASFKSAENITDLEAETTYHQLREANYILIGPGSPTYAVRQLRTTPIPGILVDMVHRGGCMVAASAAALTMGSKTLPVYEIYKVGHDLYWENGMGVLDAFGLNTVVVPHWNNAEGGTHDTRFCFMGETRFDRLATMLPNDVSIIGIDEHTACIINLESGEARVRGLGKVLLRHGSREVMFEKGDRFPISAINDLMFDRVEKQAIKDKSQNNRSDTSNSDNEFWETIHSIRNSFLSGIENSQSEKIVNALLELDSTLWRAQLNLENEEFISQGRETLRDLIVLLGPALKKKSLDLATALAPMIEEMLSLRDSFRQNKQWESADAIRKSLERMGCIVEDTPEGVQWRVISLEQNLTKR